MSLVVTVLEKGINKLSFHMSFISVKSGFRVITTRQKGTILAPIVRLGYTRK